MSKSILEGIEEYLKKEDTDYAIMINGAWGSGKTYFVRNEFLIKNSNPLYISLYGLNCEEEISEKIYYEILKNKMVTSKTIKWIINVYENNIFFSVVLFPFYLIITFLKKVFRLLQKLLWYITQNVVKWKFGYDLSNLKKKDFVGMVNLYEKIDKYLLIFDDFERCSMNYSDVFGFLNNFVEHKHVKCILIANEEEINNTLKKNYELKILTVLNSNINFSMVNKQENNIIKPMKSDFKGILNKDDLDRRIEYLYSDSCEYKRIKEKTIGKTFNCYPDLNIIFDNIIEKVSNKNARRIIKDNKAIIIESFDTNNCQNVRTLKITIGNIESIYEKVCNYIDAEYKNKAEDLYNKIIRNITVATIGFKNGYSLSKLLNGSIFAMVTFENTDNAPMSKYFPAFDFVNNYIECSIFDTDKMKKTMKYYFETEYYKIPESDPFYILDIYWEQEDDILLKALGEIHINLNSNVYNYRLFPKILAKISCLENIGFEKNKTDEIVEHIKDYFKVNEVDYIDFDSFLNNKDTIDIYNNHISKINEHIKYNKIKSKNELLEEIYTSDNWGVELYEYSKKNRDTFLSDKSFINNINVDNIIENLKDSSNNNIFHFKYCIDSVYNFGNLKDYYKNDLGSLKKLIKEINKMHSKEKSIMKKCAYNVLLNKLEKTVSILKDSNVEEVR